LRWAGGAFDALGPINRQTLKTAPASVEMMRFSRRVIRDRSVLPGSVAEDLLHAVEAGALVPSEGRDLMFDYLGPSLDTTIGATSSALYLFATHPDQWQMLKSDPGLIPNAVNEVVRFESPLRALSRKVIRDVELSGTTLARGSRVLVIYASGNRDALERDAPDTFDIGRDASRQLGFGHGTHGCAGQGLARLETQAMLRALVDRVDSGSRSLACPNGP